MTWLVIGAGVLLGLLYLGGAFRKVDPAKLAKQLRVAGGVGGLAVAAVLAVTGRWAAAVPIGVFALSLLGYDYRGIMGGGGWRGIPGRRSPGTGSSTNGTARSRVATATLELELDHATGEMQGRVVAGPYAGRVLDAMAATELMRLRADLAADRESLSLLDAYLDRRQPGWREDVQRDADAGEARASRPGMMSAQEAHETLGLQPGATEAEIRDAHRRLIKRVHPDAGGSAGLAAKINEAKERLLGGHRER